MDFLKVSLGIFIALAVSRFIPHPPNFTSLIALSFYIPAVFGFKYIFILMLCFLITDLFIGFHSLTLFTWGSVILIGYLSKFFINSFLSRISGAIISAFIFFLVTNFGVWILGSYGYTFNGLVMCYMLAIPFFGNTLVSTILFSLVIEGILKINFIKNYSLIKIK
tara:strand:+ start:1921 stop:2415 length:495 start_codon:yes stop_codon:yes gene_type:complete